MAFKNAFCLALIGLICTAISGSGSLLAKDKAAGRKKPRLASGVGVSFSQTDTRTVSNSSAETSLFATTGIGSREVSSGFFQPGRTFQVQLRGTLNTLASSPGTITVKVKLGSTLLATTVITPEMGLAGQYWEADVLVTVKTAGPTGQALVAGNLRIEPKNATTIMLREFKLLPTSNPVNGLPLNANQTLDVTVQFQTANAGNSMTSIIGIVD